MTTEPKFTVSIVHAQIYDLERNCHIADIRAEDEQVQRVTMDCFICTDEWSAVSEVIQKTMKSMVFEATGATHLVAIKSQGGAA